MKTISFKISETLDSQILQLAKHSKQNKSELIRDVLKRFVFSKKKETALSRIHDLVGSIEGPEDLSYNKTYLNHLGKNEK